MGNIKLEKSKSQSMFCLFLLLLSLVVWCLPAKAQVKYTVIATWYQSDAREVSLPDVFIKWANLAPGAFNNDKWYPGPDTGRKHTEGGSTWNWNTLDLPPEARPVPPDFDFAKHKEAFKQFYKNESFEVRITWRGKTVTAPVNISWDSLGPWNFQDNYWDPAEHSDPSRKRRLHASLPSGLPASEAAWDDRYNYMDGKDEAGRKTNGAGIDFSKPLADELGFTGKDNVEVEFLWVSDGDNPPVVNYFNVTPESVTLGDSFTIDYTVSDDIGLKQTELWRANDSGGSPVDWAEIKRTPLSGQTSYTGSFTDAPSSTGTYWYGMHVVDTAGQWSCEPDPPGPIKVTVTIEKPDLIVDDIWIDPDPPEAGASNRIRFRIKNQGDGDAVGTFRSKLYFDDVYRVYADTDGLTAGSTKTYYWDMTWPSDSNPHTIRVVVDADGAITESNEGNNERSESFSDLIPETISKPGTPTGETNPTVNVSYTYTTSGATSSLGHTLEYRFDWGDGSQSNWSTSKSASHSWSSTEQY